MPKWTKTVIAICLLPFCVGAVSALLRTLAQTGHADTVWVALVGGVACWLVIYLLLPKPMLVYVFGHELTHALWNWLFGGRLKKFKASSSGGHVVVTKSNFLITLAPYFFPLYAVLVTLGFGLGHLAFGWTRFLPWFHLLLGAAYCFHVTLTWHILKTRQSDITSQGYLFSGVVIFLGNISVLLLGVPLLVGQPGLLTTLGWWLRDTGAIWQRLGHIF